MSKTIEVRVPDIGDFDTVEVVEVLIVPGDEVEFEQSLITLESDKASMEVPSTHAGIIQSVAVRPGDLIGQGAVIASLQVAAAPPTAKQAAGSTGTAESVASANPKPSAPALVTAPAGDADVRAEVLVLGSGPGGYTAAFRAADLGKRVVLVERFPRLGGVCLNVGCIPSKALLHAAKVIDDAADMAPHGVHFGEPTVDLAALRGWKDGVVERLTGGLASMAKQRKVEVVHGRGHFTDPHSLTVTGDPESGDTDTTIAFEQAIIAVGSRIVELPGFPYGDPRLLDSTSALDLAAVDGRMLIVGGGIIGLEMATVYAALGARITVVELMDGLIPGCDKDLVRPLQRRIAKQYENIYLSTKVTGIDARDEGLHVTFDGPKAPAEDVFDRILVAVGRRPNGGLIQADTAGVAVDDRGFIAVDKQMRTNVPHIFAIGDVVGQPMLAHKAVHEGKVAAEVTAGHNSHFDARVIPSVAYTDPEVAWAGLTETQAKAEGIAYEKGAFPWAASGRALSLGRGEGTTKLLFDPTTKKVLGAGIAGPQAGDLIAETALAIELGADAEDLSLTIHPHPTLSETVAFAAEVFEGTITDLYLPKKS